MREYGTGSVSQRKDGTWTGRLVVGRQPNGKKKIKAFYGKSEREVKRMLKNYREELIKNDNIVVERETVSTYMLRWLTTNKKNELKTQSYDRLEQTLRCQVLPYIGHLQVGALKPDDIQNMINSLYDAGKSRSTIKKAYEAVNACFNSGIKQRTVSFNPASAVTIPSTDKFDEKEVQYFTKDEVKKIYNVVRNFKYKNGKPMFRLGHVLILTINTGMRIGEVLALRWSDVDIENKTLHVRRTQILVKDIDAEPGKKYSFADQSSAKSASSDRIVPLNDDAYQAILNLKETTGKSKYVVSGLEGNPLEPANLRKLLMSVLRLADIPEDRRFGFHALRHTFASMLFANQVDIKTISELLGHADVSVTYSVYIHLIEETKVAATNTISNLISE